MAVTFLDNINYKGNKPDFVRQEYATFADMLAVKDSRMPELYIAYCLQDRNYYKYDKNNEVDPVTGKFRLWASGGGSSGLEENINVNTPVGNIKSGDTFASGSSITTLLKTMLVAPVYFRVVLTTNANSIYRIGESIDDLTITATVTRSDTDIKQIDYYIDNTKVATKDANSDPNIGLGGEFTYSYRNVINSTVVVKVEVTDVNDHKEVMTKSIEFVNPYYYGTSNTNVLENFSGLTEDLTVKANTKSIKYSGNNSYFVFAYDANYGNLISIKDQNNFENISSWTKSELIVNHQRYNVYVTNTKITVTGFEYTFKLQ